MRLVDFLLCRGSPGRQLDLKERILLYSLLQCIPRPFRNVARLKEIVVRSLPWPNRKPYQHYTSTLVPSRKCLVLLAWLWPYLRKAHVRILFLHSMFSRNYWYCFLRTVSSRIGFVSCVILVLFPAYYWRSFLRSVSSFGFFAQRSVSSQCVHAGRALCVDRLS